MEHLITINANEIIHSTGSPDIVWEKLLRNNGGVSRLHQPKKGWNGEEFWIEGNRDQHIKVRYNQKKIELTPDNRNAYIVCFQRLNYILLSNCFVVKIKSIPIHIVGIDNKFEACCDDKYYGERELIELISYIESDIKRRRRDDKIFSM